MDSGRNKQVNLQEVVVSMLELVQVQPEIKEKILDIRGEQEGRDRLSKHHSLTGQLYARPGET